jgi:signal transduction histidine kinase
MPPWAQRARSSAKVSVDRRLIFLILCEMITATLIIVAAALALGRVADDRAYMDRYVFAPLVDIGQALAASDEIRAHPVDPEKARGAILRLRGFLGRYVRDWETPSSSSPEAVRLRDELTQAGESSLLEREHQTVEEWSRALGAVERSAGLTEPTAVDPAPSASSVAALNRALVELNLINLRYVQIAYRNFERTHLLVTGFFFMVSAAGLAGATILGLSVRRAIVPRVQRMVQAVHGFRDKGCVPDLDDGDDDLGELARALRLSFKGIADRDRERERFLARAAHELKTPLSNLKGYAQAALAHPDDNSIRARALAVIDRQATRLARLAQDLLWSARADAGRLPFHPAPVDLAALARRVITEFRVISEDAFDLVSSGDTHVLGDAGLLEQAVWNLLCAASGAITDGTPVRVCVNGTPSLARLSCEVRTALAMPENLDELTEPFPYLPVERGGNVVRGTGLGLHLVLAIARLHGASFRLERREGDRIAGVLELRR